MLSPQSLLRDVATEKDGTFFRFPNLVVCNLSRASVREALTRGITAEQASTW